MNSNSFQAPPTLSQKRDEKYQQKRMQSQI
jgi:hypothetical protein